jgi:hypothetical protein
MTSNIDWNIQITSTLKKEAASSPNILVSNHTATLHVITFSRPTSVKLWTWCSKLQFYYNAQWQNATPQLRNEVRNYLAFIWSYQAKKKRVRSRWQMAGNYSEWHQIHTWSEKQHQAGGPWKAAYLTMHIMTDTDLILKAPKVKITTNYFIHLWHILA